MTKNPASVASRLAIQMNAKLGGEPWAVDIPLKDLMIIGYDVYHSGNKRSPSVGALVASTSSTLAKYFASTYFHNNRSELSANLCSQMTSSFKDKKNYSMFINAYSKIKYNELLCISRCSSCIQVCKRQATSENLSVPRRCW